MRPETLSRELRFGSGRFLGLRRKVLSLSLLTAGAMMPISLYQSLAMVPCALPEARAALKRLQS